MPLIRYNNKLLKGPEGKLAKNLACCCDKCECCDQDPTSVQVVIGGVSKIDPFYCTNCGAANGTFGFDITVKNIDSCFYAGARCITLDPLNCSSTDEETGETYSLPLMMYIEGNFQVNGCQTGFWYPPLSDLVISIRCNIYVQLFQNFTDELICTGGTAGGNSWYKEVYIPVSEPEDPLPEIPADCLSLMSGEYFSGGTEGVEPCIWPTKVNVTWS